MPPSESPSFAAASISAIMASAAAWSKQRTGDSSTASRSAGAGRTSLLVRAPPIWMTWLSTDTPSSASRALARQPAATRAAVSRALARSSTSRASPKPYFCMPARSAWPGRGWVRGCSVRPGAADISWCQRSDFDHSLFLISMATGDPSVRPWRIPPSSVISSASNRIRGPRPKPSRRRASSPCTSSAVTASPAGSPSTMTTRAGPCDSPAVR